MRIAQTEEGGLRIILTEDREWELFELLIVDAEGRGEGWLAKRLGVIMDDEDWDEFVAPELTTQFQEAVEKIRTALRVAFDESMIRLKESERTHEPNLELPLDDEEEKEPRGEILIVREEGQTWYSVFNQARLALEGKWKLAALENEEDFESLEKIESERLAAYLRYQFYTRLQTFLLDFAIEL